MVTKVAKSWAGDYRFWFILLQVVILSFQFFSHQKITTNDLHHLELDVKELQSSFDSLDQRMDTFIEDLAFIKGFFESKK